MLPTLPVGPEDSVERLQSARTQMDKLKPSGQAVASEVLTSLSGVAPPMLLALGGRLAARSPDLRVQTGVTNVPGPQQPLQTLAPRLLESFPLDRQRPDLSCPTTVASTSASPGTTTAPAASAS